MASAHPGSAQTNGDVALAPPPPSPPQNDILGVAICGNCQARFRVRQKYKPLIGKVIRCLRCHQEFKLLIEAPTPVENAAISIAEQPKPKRKKRTKAQLLKHNVKAIQKAMRPYHSRLTQLASQDKCSEEQIRVWCIDVLRNVLGHKDCDIDTEMFALNQRIDIVIKCDGKVFMVIECKNTRSKLPPNTVKQAVQYAASKSADWAVVTSGQVWKLIRVFPVKGADPKTFEVFDLSLLDADGCSDADAANLYLLTSRALFRGETEKRFHKVACLANSSLLSAITTPRVIKALRRSLLEAYRKSTKQRVRLTEDEVEQRVCDMFLPADLSDTPNSTEAKAMSQMA